MPRGFSVFLFFIFAISGSLWGFGMAPLGPDYPGVVRTSFYIPSYDGTKLAIDLYRPAVNGKAVDDRLPAVYVQSRSPGFVGGPDRSDFQGMKIEDFVRHGYVWIGQDRRGVGASYGSQRGFITQQDALDGKAVIEWIGNQPWSNGKVAELGGSNQGEIQFAVAATSPRGLVAISPAVANPDFFQMIIPNGVPQLPYGLMGNVTVLPCKKTDKIGTPVDDDAAPNFPEATQAALEHRCNLTLLDQYPLGMARDDWNDQTQTQPGIENSPIFSFTRLRKTHPQLYQFGGWYESNVGGQLLAFQLWGGKIVIGPWGHGGTIAGKSMGMPNLPNSTLNMTTAHLQWLDSVVKGQGNDFSSAPAVRYYTIHAKSGAEWSSSTTWPPQEQKPQQFFLGSTASGTVNALYDGSLATSAEMSPAKDTFPSDYSADLFDGKYFGLDRDWPGDMTKSIDTKGAAYTTPALPRDTQITGVPLAHLWVSSTATDGDFFVFLEDVGPDNVSNYVSHGVIRASRPVSPSEWDNQGLPYHRDFRQDRKPLVPGQASLLDFALGPTSYVFAAGHRIRVTITTCAGKTYQSLAFFPAPEISVYHDGKHGSYVTLPLMPATP